MQLTADQELRKELLLFALGKQSDLVAAAAMAAQMERLVLEGFGTTVGAPSSTYAPQSATDSGQDCACSCGADAEPGAYGSGGTKRRWSLADDARLVELWRSPSELEEIAAILDRTIPSLYSRARALDLEKRAQKAETRVAVRSNAIQADSGFGVGAVDPAPSLTSAEDPSSQPAQSAADDSSINHTGREMKVDRYRAPSSTGVKRFGQTRRTAKIGARSGSKNAAANSSPRSVAESIGVESIVQFLRSRDYSVVRVSEGRFRLDGRQVLSVDELREKANKVRKTLGQPPFVSHGAEPVF